MRPIAAEIHLGVSAADVVVVRAWDGNSLTLFGDLYGIVVTVIGVVIAVLWPLWWVLLLYALVSVVLLAILLSFFGQPIIEGMRRLIERGKRPPPWPFNRRFRS